MNTAILIAISLFVALTGIVITWLITRMKYTVKIDELKETLATVKANHEAAIKSLREQKTFIENSEKAMKDAFGALAGEALKTNNLSFVELAKAKLEEKVTDAKGDLDKKEQAIKSLVTPLTESLTKMDEKIN